MRTALLLLLSCLPVAANAARLLAVTTEFPPFQSAGPQPWGLALQAAKALAARNGDTLDIRFLPWARAYQIAESTPDTLIFCLARTPARETRYGWVGQIARNDVQLWRLRSRPEVAPRTLAAARRWQLGVTAQDMKTRYLLQHGFVMNDNLQESSDDLSNIHKLFAGRIDLLPFSSSTVLHYWLASNGLDGKALEPALALPAISGALYLAFSPGSNRQRAANYAAQFRRLQQDGSLTRWRAALQLPPEPPPP
ncbi:hypothetical protein ACFOLG_02070 [Vogesella facilis]|uniref:Solute-binding protein family 3/N-terminal domain-containing protein n=1 Tax=Vogesella facilis TaxID=1655232 RepID=A0ABV7RCE6_9NEIS